MKQILLLQTGGTIAMNVDENNTPVLDSQKWTKSIYKAIPELEKIADISMEQLFFTNSSAIHARHWIELAEYIYKNYAQYDGFVILHGTDTMAYTASALSFALQGLNKPVILTGSQVPLSNIRSDAPRNLINAIEMATLPVPEVAICFNDFVYRGNRAIKKSIKNFDAFHSPNYPPLAEIGGNINLASHIRNPSDNLELYTSFSDQLFLLKIYPNLNPDLLNSINLDSCRALVIEAFGSGNFPAHGRRNLLPFLERCLSNDVMLVITSQAAHDAVILGDYESGRKALQMGALSTKDMTTEATLAKTMHLLGRFEGAAVAEQFHHNLAGEITL